jgi:hypothetical protein
MVIAAGALPKDVSREELSIENKGFSTALPQQAGVQFFLVTKVRPVTANPNKEGPLHHVEADQSASDACPPC